MVSVDPTLFSWNYYLFSNSFTLNLAFSKNLSICTQVGGDAPQAYRCYSTASQKNSANSVDDRLRVSRTFPFSSVNKYLIELEEPYYLWTVLGVASKLFELRDTPITVKGCKSSSPLSRLTSTWYEGDWECFTTTSQPLLPTPLFSPPPFLKWLNNSLWKNELKREEDCNFETLIFTTYFTNYFSRNGGERYYFFFTASIDVSLPLVPVGVWAVGMMLIEWLS